MYTCPFCGFKTLEEKPPGTFEICELCGWEVDTVQSIDPDYEGGPNGLSLRQYQHEFMTALKKEKVPIDYVKDEEWKPLTPPTYIPERAKTDYIVDTKGNAKNNDSK